MVVRRMGWNPLESIRAVFSKGGERKQSGQETGSSKTPEIVRVLQPMVEELAGINPEDQPVIIFRPDGSLAILRWDTGELNGVPASRKVRLTADPVTGMAFYISAENTGWSQLERRTDCQPDMSPEQKTRLAVRWAQPTPENPHDTEGCIGIPDKAQSEAR